MSTAAVITTLNEAATIGPLVERLLALKCWPVIVIDDGSTDGTPMQARTAGAMVACNPSREGIGPSLHRAWRLALFCGAERMVQLDAGGSHDAADVPRLLAALDAGADMVIGSRFRRGSRYLGGPWHRPILSRLAAWACNLAQPGAQHTDWTSGYRAFTAAALRTLYAQPTHARMHGWQLEVLAHAGAAGLRIAEVPITYRAGRSSFGLKVAGEALLAWSSILHHVGPVPRKVARA